MDYLPNLGKFKNIYLIRSLRAPTTTTQCCPFIRDSHGKLLSFTSSKRLQMPFTLPQNSRLALLHKIQFSDFSLFLFAYCNTAGGGRANVLTWEARDCDIIVWHIINTWWLWMQPPMLGWRIHSSRNWNVLSFKQGGVTIKIIPTRPLGNACPPVSDWCQHWAKQKEQQPVVALVMSPSRAQSLIMLF